MDRLPVELVSLVCSFLQPIDVGNLRCISKNHAKIGWLFMFRQLHFNFTPKSFERLHAISSDPGLAVYVTSLYYATETMPFYDSLDHWQRNPFGPQLSSRLGSVEPPDQQELYLGEKIAKAMVLLPNLEEIAPLLERWPAAPSKPFQYAHNDSAIITYGDESWTEETHGMPQTLSFPQGSTRTQKKLKVLHAGIVDWKFFEQCDEVFEDMQKAVQNLQELRLELSAKLRILKVESSLSWTEHYNLRSQRLKYVLLRTMSERLRAFLAATPNLRLLGLGFSLKGTERLPSTPIDLRSAVGTQKWECLAEVTLSCLNSCEHDLVGFCEMHALTLEKLVLNELWLLPGSWLSTYQKMRRLLHLKEAKVRGRTRAYNHSDECWNFPMMESPGESPMSRVVQEYLLQGGDGPLLDLNQI